MTEVRTMFTAAILLWIFSFPALLAGAFSETPPRWSRLSTRAANSQSSTTLWYVDDEESGVVKGNPSDQPSESAALHKALGARNDELSKRIGLRYLVCTKDKGTVNVYRDPKSSPYSTHNVIGALKHGKIVKSIGEPLGNWIHHEEGWSLAQFEGFDNLIRIEE